MCYRDQILSLVKDSLANPVLPIQQIDTIVQVKLFIQIKLVHNFLVQAPPREIKYM